METKRMYPDSTAVHRIYGERPFVLVLDGTESSTANVYLSRHQVEVLMEQLRHEWAEFVSKGVRQ